MVRMTETFTSSAFHFVYNTASISVLQGIGPLNCAFLKPFETIMVILTNIGYFKTPPLTWAVSLSLPVLFVGLFLHSKPSAFKHVKLLLFYSLCTSAVIFVSVTAGFSKTELSIFKFGGLVSDDEVFTSKK